MLLRSERVLASVCEAIIGASFLAFGFDRTAPAVVRSFSEETDDALEHPIDYRSLLRERLAQRPEVVGYRIDAGRGPRPTAASCPWPRSAAVGRRPGE